MYSMFGIPYAGGSALSYGGWKRQLAPLIDFVPIELAGRGARIDEPFYGSMEEAVADIEASIVAQLNTAPFSIYGHSMGALLGFEVAHRLSQSGRPPQHLFVSGRIAPHRDRLGRSQERHSLGDRALIEEIIAMGGTPREIFEQQELADLLLPIFRADFRIVESYQFVGKPCKLPCDVTVFYGDEENISFEDAVAWEEHSDKSCQVYSFAGDHFFIRSHEEAVLKRMQQQLYMGWMNR